MELKYSTIKARRLAISAYHDYVENSLVVTNPGVSGLITGLSNVKLFKPKYVFI